MCACLLNCSVCPNDRYARNNYVEGWMHVLVYTHWRCVCVLECWALCSCMGSLQQYYNIQFMCVHFEKPKNAYKNKHYEMCAHSHTFSHVHMRSNVDVRPLAYSIPNEKKWEFYICTFWYCFYIYCIERLGDAFYFYTFSVCTIRETHIDICTHRIWTFMLLFLFLFLSSSLFFGSQFNVSTPNTAYTMKKC